MRGQSRRHSLFESLVNVFVGFGIATIANFVILPWFGHNVSFGDSAGIGLLMTVVSIARSYALRRFFNWIYLKESHRHV